MGSALCATNSVTEAEATVVDVTATKAFPTLLGAGDQNLKRSSRLSVQVHKMKELIELQSNSDAAMEQYKSLAQNFAAELEQRSSQPQTEAFIERLLFQEVLTGCLFVGHVKTDLDSVAGAIGGAYLWGGIATRAERDVNGEIKHALAFAGLDEPPFFDDVPGAKTLNAQGELLRVCLVDHNEEKQMVPSLRKCPNRSKRICGLIDHHALSESFASERPLFMDVRPWGSMSTIVAHAFLRSSKKLPKPIARILLTAILSDTLNLQSVTTTQADRMMVPLLAIMGDVSECDELARELFQAKTQWIVNLGAYEMVRGDQKDFTCCGWKLGISVLEVTDTAPVLAVANEILLELRIVKVEKGDQDGKHDRRSELDFAFVFVVDVTRQCSVLLVCGGRELSLAKAAFPGATLRAANPGMHAPGETIKPEETLMDVGPLVSRKAQFAPAFLQALSSGFHCHKKPMSQLEDSELCKLSEEQTFKQIQAMKQESVHDSVCTVRNYKRLSGAYQARVSTNSAQGLI